MKKLKTMPNECNHININTESVRALLGEARKKLMGQPNIRLTRVIPTRDGDANGNAGTLIRRGQDDDATMSSRWPR